MDKQLCTEPTVVLWMFEHPMMTFILIGFAIYVVGNVFYTIDNIFKNKFKTDTNAQIIKNKTKEEPK